MDYSWKNIRYLFEFGDYTAAKVTASAPLYLPNLPTEKTHANPTLSRSSPHLRKAGTG